VIIFLKNNIIQIIYLRVNKINKDIVIESIPITESGVEIKDEEKLHNILNVSNKQHARGLKNRIVQFMNDYLCNNYNKLSFDGLVEGLLYNITPLCKHLTKIIYLFHQHIFTQFTL